VKVPAFYAHTLEGEPPTKWQGLEEHLRGVASLASGFAKAFDSESWGYCAGLWHDLGKYQAEFQERLLGSRVSVEHSGAGAALASKKSKELGLPLAFVIAGHHAGIANLVSSEPGLPTPLQERLKENASALEGIRPVIPAQIAGRPIAEIPAFLRAKPGLRRNEIERLRRASEFWTRFLFSALVDADRLDTEAFCEADKAALRSRFSSIVTLRERLDSFIDQKMDALPTNEKTTPVNLSRAEILQACRKAATLLPGVFSLTVPTGGGKTLSAMSFALNHAERYGLRRVIVVIPYTSIIEQNADVYSQGLGAENVVEHHSSLDPDKKRTKYGEELTGRHELACENWDAPVIVTTTVQFFESLFSNHSSRCRKVHNIARSVIVLDEVQSLPPGFLLSIVEALNELATHYGCSIVLSTATPPALAARERFEMGLAGIREIVGNTKELAEKLKRVEYEWPAEGVPSMTWPQLAGKMAEHHQVLAVVHKRDDACALARELKSVVPDECVWHLSALMCAAHRSESLVKIKDALARGAACRVVSTQLVEAGVDLDFPVVYRALGGLDSIVQAAGRCNREGHLDRGRVIVFRAQTSPPRGTPRQAMEVTETLLSESGGDLDPSDPDLFEKYFRMLYLVKDLDAKRIQTFRQEFSFASVGREFKLIEDGFTRPVVVPYGEAGKHVQELRQLRHQVPPKGPTRETMRGLQRFIVNIYPDAFAKFSAAGALEEVIEGTFVLAKPYEKSYDDTFGLLTGDEPQADPAALIG
jgi:CRISPR-associated endonuclease/helicase Cas3